MDRYTWRLLAIVFIVVTVAMVIHFGILRFGEEIELTGAQFVKKHWLGQLVLFVSALVARVSFGMGWRKE